MDQIYLRSATLNDYAQLRPLVAQMGPNYNQSDEQIKDRIRAFLSRDWHELIVAVNSNDLIVGVAGFGCYEHLRLPGKCLHLDTIVVDKNSRKQGIATKLMKFIEKYAKDNGILTIEFTSANFRKLEGTHEFYKSLGYIDHIEEDCSFFLKVIK
jgi:GNAT superfamily N-acetyltransferase